ncbi:MAG TPA: hypothetical protein PLT00_15805 [Verrucomicrobiota bacterium]|nr:hypothetical protein [Verrucomicrobiota bacterium]OQB94279.1 MAG: hypothetical protein BWX84_00264 [Verrucomicrobia bacterium ADurb.Bin118]HPY32017.1 hypothetical protein [Verrucomicrobiota bacterium]HQB18162.1 hypothetical protein [Verrucomicrobiota bacterium]
MKKLKNTLLERQVLIASNEGYTIRLPGHVLVPDSQGSHFVTESEAIKNGYKTALPTPRLVPALDLCKEWAHHIKYLRTLHDIEFGWLQEYTEKMRKRVEVESPDGSERDQALALMKANEDRYFALQYVYENIPRKHEAEYRKQVDKGTPEQLADFRERVEGMSLAGLPEPKQLALATDAISQITR